MIWTLSLFAQADGQKRATDTLIRTYGHPDLNVSHFC